MKKISLLFALAGTTASVAMGQPAADLTFNPLPAGDTTGSVTVGAAGVKWVKFVTTVDNTEAASRYLDISTTGPAGGNTEIGVYTEAGALVASNDNDGPGDLSVLTFGTGGSSPTAYPFDGINGDLAAGTYYLALGFWNTTFNPAAWDAFSVSTAAGDIGFLISTGDFVPTPPPPAVSLDPPSWFTHGGTWFGGLAIVAAGGDVAWFSFVAPAGLSATGALDIDVQGTALVPANDTVGTGNTILPGETYYLAVAGGNDATHATPFNTAGGTNTGTVFARVRAWSSDAPSSGDATPPASIDLVDLQTFGLAGGTENVITSAWTMTGPDEVKWFKFTTTADALNASTSYFDIDTDNTSPGGESLIGNLQDTYLGVYDSSGTLRTEDDNDGISNRSAISYGDNVNVRAANVPVAPNLAGEDRNGRDGDLPAGTYYVVVTTFLPTFYADYFDVAPPTNRTAVGDRVLAVRTNFASSSSTASSPGTCSATSLAPARTPRRSTAS
ncbi:MAG: hypothetical protein LW822_06955 [Phycisphaeraceae bacterium]|nr:hypothetical protein [Phycisphaeraceae bacterium]